jgi:CheY-like chemotaxis protein
VARLLREQAQGHDLRLIALTPSREHAGLELPRVAGFERYLLKPVAADELAGLFPVTAPEKPIQGTIHLAGVAEGEKKGYQPIPRTPL